MHSLWCRRTSLTPLLLASTALPSSINSPRTPLHQARPLASSILVFPPKKSSRTKPTTFPVLLKDHLPRSVTPHLLQKVQINPHASRGPRNWTACAEPPQGELRATLSQDLASKVLPKGAQGRSPEQQAQQSGLHWPRPSLFILEKAWADTPHQLFSALEFLHPNWP